MSCSGVSPHIGMHGSSGEMKAADRDHVGKDGISFNEDDVRQIHHDFADTANTRPIPSMFTVMSCDRINNTSATSGKLKDVAVKHSKVGTCIMISLRIVLVRQNVVLR